MPAMVSWRYGFNEDKVAHFSFVHIGHGPKTSPAN